MLEGDSGRSHIGCSYHRTLLPRQQLLGKISFCVYVRLAQRESEFLIWSVPSLWRCGNSAPVQG